jgi:hypothetical protein
MLRESDDEGNWYQSVWHAGDQELLVVVRHPGLEMFGTPYHVFVLDRSLRLLRRGTIVAGEGDWPYSLVEVKTAGETVPAAYRGRWVLAIALWPDTQAYDPSHPVYEVSFSRGNMGSRERKPNRVYVEPVAWDNDGEEFEYGAKRLIDAEDVQIRRAEPAR